MILKALCEYYDRKRALGKMPPFGYEWKGIPYLIVIDKDGGFISLESTYEGEGKQRRAKIYSMPIGKGRSGSKSYTVANDLWDHYGYVLGIAKGSKKSDSKKEAARKKDEEAAANQHEYFKSNVERLAHLNADNKGIQAVAKFYSKSDSIDKVKKDPLLEEVLENDGVNLAFRLDGDVEPVGSEDSINLGESGDKSSEGICLVYGEKMPIALLHGTVSLKNASSMGAKLIGFQKNSGYDSYHKEQGLNAPVSETANFKYTSALNNLLDFNSKNKIFFGADTLTFWAEKDSEVENQFSFFFSAPMQDDPDRNVEEISNLMKAPVSGTINVEDEKTHFYLLMMSPANKRISVRLWVTTTLVEMSKNIREFFEEFDIVRSKHDCRYYTLIELLRSIALEGKDSNLPSNLFKEMMQSIIENKMYPYYLQTLCLGRIKADRVINAKRCSILKGYLIRKQRLNRQTNNKELAMSLDITNTNQAYLCGRLFAILEKIQEDAAESKLNATIRDRYYSSASRTPKVVFPRLLALSNHHLSKMEKHSVYYEKLKGEVLDKIDAEGLPSYLSLDDQSRFAIGYYHQRQDFFKPKKENENIK